MSVPKHSAYSRIGSGPSLEVYLDPLCPFSAKIARSLDENVVPQITKGGKYEGKLSVVIRLYPQPFHYYSALVIEAIIVVANKYPHLFWPYLLAVFDQQKEFFNRPASGTTPAHARDQLVGFAVEEVIPANDPDAAKGPKSKLFGELRDALEIKESENGGTEGTEGLKYVNKLGRQNGINVTPTVLWDGLIDNNVSSSWGKEDWNKFIAEKTA
ncbi:hypothetical protein B9479_004932 [Cryptococcus floricola]|uniref:Uncharacterized protein n=1 Tax=Cryptococcus floricola TaxID=2591691 RepID=A0A5D3AUB5_9TREE|nr:hypothetical protein B9479_004932 [Cryptococcus floricola]